MSRKGSDLIQKIDDFIKKYYVNELIKGLLAGASLLAAMFLILNYSEYFFNFSSVTRTILFFGFIVLFIFVAVFWILRPIFKLYNIGRDLSREQAAVIIGKHFKDVEDRLLNALYLQAETDNQLAAAMVEKRSRELTPVPFEQAVDFRTNLNFLKYLIPSILIGTVTYFVFPEILSVGTERIVNYKIPYEKMAPFTFNILNDELTVKKGEDLEVAVRLEGSSLPEQLSLKDENGIWRMQQSSTGTFSIRLSGIEKNREFKFVTEKYESGFYEINVLDAPEFGGFEVIVEYPEHIEKETETFSGMSELVLPEGSNVSWNFNVRNAREIILFSDSVILRSPDISKTLSDKFTYSVALEGEHYSDTVIRDFFIDVVKDAHPEISVEMRRDSTNLNSLYFMGELSDDNGLAKLDVSLFGTRKLAERFSGDRSERFFYRVDLDSIESNESGIFFEVFDNDAVNNFKSSRSQVFFVEKLNAKEKSEIQRQKASKLERDMNELKKLSDEISKETEDFQKELIRKEKTDWQDKKRVEDLLEKQKKLEKKSRELKKEKNELSKMNEQNFEMSEELREKQKKLDELFEKLMEDEELKELFEEMEKLKEELNREDLMDKLEDINFEQEELSKQLDRELELFKRLELEKDWENAADRLEELEEKQDELLNDDEMSSEEMKEAQEELKEEFDELKEEVKEMEKRAEELGMDELDIDDEQMDSVSEDMENAAENAGDGNKKDAKQKQSDAKQKMQKMKDQMNSAMEMQQSMSLEMDIDALRQIQQNLIRLSFNQEDLIEIYKNTDDSDPKYVKLINDQQKIRDDTKVVEDSLNALAKRVFFLEDMISEELKNINSGLRKSVNHMVEREKRQALVNGREVMTSYNNLALLIGEMLEQMQQQMAQQKFGEGKCNKPGSGGKPSSGQMKSIQEQMKKNMEKMKEMLGKQKGGEKKGEEGEKGKSGSGGGMSEELSKMIGRQKAMRNMLRQMAEEESKKESGGSSRELKEIEKKLEENEDDLINKRIDIETLRRQQDIMTRMLEAETAMREQDMQEERESEVGEKKQKDVPPEILEYLKEKERSADLFRKTPAELNRFYRDRVSKYFE